MDTFLSWADTSQAERIERLENVLRVLHNLTPHQREQHWDMGIWGEQTICGTVCCAAGFCGLDPWFQERGLKMNFIPKEVPEMGGDWWAWTSPWPSKEGEYFSFAVERFFGPAAERVFLDLTPRPVETVIAEIAALILKERLS